jgi:hypothetical protein
MVLLASLVCQDNQVTQVEMARMAKTAMQASLEGEAHLGAEVHRVLQEFLASLVCRANGVIMVDRANPARLVNKAVSVRLAFLARVGHEVALAGLGGVVLRVIWAVEEDLVDEGQWVSLASQGLEEQWAYAASLA